MLDRGHLATIASERRRRQASPAVYRSARVLRPLAIALLVQSACAGAGATATAPAPARPNRARTPEELREQAAAQNDAWQTLRASVTITLELHTESGTERRAFDATLLCERPGRMRLRAVENDRVYFDLLWLGATPQLLRSLPDDERPTRLREVLASLADDLRIALRMGDDRTTRIEAGWTEAVAATGEPPLLELREIEDRALVRRSTYDPATLLRHKLEQGHAAEVARTIHYTSHRPTARSNLASRFVVVNEQHDYWLSVELRSVVTDEALDPSLWVP